MSLADRVCNFLRAIRELLNNVGTDAVFLKELGSTLGSLDIEAEVVEAADERKRLLLITVGDSSHYSTVVLKVHAGCLERLIERTVVLIVIADSLTGGLHLGGEICVKTAELVEGEHGNLNVPSLLLLGIEVKDALLLQGLAKDTLGGNISKAVACCLGEEGYGSGGTRVNLDDINLIVSVNDELDIVKTNDADAETKLLRILKNSSLHLIGDREGGIYADRVTRVDTGTLNKLHDTGHKYVTSVTDSVNLNLLTDDVLINENRLVLINLNGGLQVVAELLLICNDLHCTTAKNEGGTNENGITDSCRGSNAILNIGNGATLGLRNIKLLKKSFKCVAVLCSVNGRTVCTDNLNTERVKRLCKVDCGLAAKRCNNALRLLKLDNIHNVLGSEGLEVELVSGGIVGGNRLGVIVNDNSLVSRLLYSRNRVNGGVVELNALTDTDRTCAENNNLFLVGYDRGILSVVGGIEVRNVCAGVTGVNHAVYGEDIILFSDTKDIKLSLAPKTCDALVREAHLLCRYKNLYVSDILGESLLHIGDILDGLKEEGCNLCNLVKRFNALATAKKLGNSEDIVVTELLKVGTKTCICHAVELLVVDMVYTNLKRSDTLKKTFLKVRADAHYLTGSLHLCAEGVGCGGKFIEGETRQLCNSVIKAGLECGGGVGNLNLVKGHTNGNLCGNACNGIAGCLGCESRATGNSGVNLNEIVLAGLGIKSELNVTATLNLKLTDKLDCGVAQHLHILLGECHDGSNNDRVACVNANGVDILHTADGDSVICAVTHNLKLNLLISLNALFNKNLMHGRKLKCIDTNLNELVLVVCEAAACTTEGECRTKNYGIADTLGSRLCLIKIVCDFGGDSGLTDRLAKLLKELSVLCPLNRLGAGAEKLGAALLKNTLLLKLHSKVKTCLTADTGKDSVGTLETKNLRNIFKGEGLHIHLVRNGGVGHDGCRVGVNENYLVALLLKCKAGLCTCIVKLCRLTDYDRARADNHNPLNISSLCHIYFLQILI